MTSGVLLGGGGDILTQEGIEVRSKACYGSRWVYLGIEVLLDAGLRGTYVESSLYDPFSWVCILHYPGGWG